MPWPFEICFTNKVNTVCGGVQVTGSQGPITRVPGIGSHGPGLKVLRPSVPFRGSQGPKSQGHRVPGPRDSGLEIPGLRVPGPGSQDPGSQVFLLDFSILSVHTIRKHIKITFRIYTAIC